MTASWDVCLVRASSRMRRTALAACLLVGVATLSGCSGGAQDVDATVGQSADGASAVAPATADLPDSEREADPVPSDAWLATAAEQFARTQDPEPSVAITGPTAASFTFDSGSASGADAISDCQIAMGAIGMEYDLTMIYPDGSVRCSDLLG